MSLLKTIRYWCGIPRARDLVGRIDAYLAGKKTVLDIGAGWCKVSEILRDRGMDVQALDVRNNSVVKGVNPVVYDGSRFPFGDNVFDLALLITVLHHTQQPEVVIREARRVSRSIVIIEDIYTTTLGKYWTFWMDSLVNLEFAGHPHSNRTDEGWRTLFNDLGLRLENAKYQRSSGVFKHATYYLET